MKIHVIFTNRFDSKDQEEVDLKNCVCGVIDTIRATSTIATILGCGGKEVIIAGNELGLSMVFTNIRAFKH